MTDEALIRAIDSVIHRAVTIGAKQGLTAATVKDAKDYAQTILTSLVNERIEEAVEASYAQARQDFIGKLPCRAAGAAP